MLQVDGITLLTNIPNILYTLKRDCLLRGMSIFDKINTSNSAYTLVSCIYHKNLKNPDLGITNYEIKKKDRVISAGTCHCFGCGKVVSIQELISNCFGYKDKGIYGKHWLLQTFDSINNRAGSIHIISIDKKQKKSNINKYVPANELELYRKKHPYMYKRYLTDNLISLYDIGYDRYTNSITFPVRDVNGNCLFVGRRSISHKQYIYPKGVSKPLYGLYEIDKIQSDSDELYVCESVFNVTTFAKWHKKSVALLGTGTEVQYNLLAQLPYRKIVIATDSDKAGERAYQKLYERLSKVVLVKRLKLKDKTKDINDYGYCNTFDEFKIRGVN